MHALSVNTRAKTLTILKMNFEIIKRDNVIGIWVKRTTHWYKNVETAVQPTN